MKTASLVQTALWLILISFFLSVPTHATVVYHWSFDQTEYVLGPTDQLTIGATLFNDASSDAPMTFGPFNVGARFVGDVPLPYHFSFGPNGDWFGLQFTGGDAGQTLTLVPGQGVHFIWGILRPNHGYVLPGIYQAPEDSSLGIGGYNQDLPVASDNTFQIVVVPEPSIGGLGALIGITAWSVRSRKFRNF